MTACPLYAFASIRNRAAHDASEAGAEDDEISFEVGGEKEEPVASTNVKIQEALKTVKDQGFRWRSAARLSQIAGVSEADIESYPDIESREDKAGNKIIRLKRPSPEGL